jgi:hypothetical protein
MPASQAALWPTNQLANAVSSDQKRNSIEHNYPAPRSCLLPAVTARIAARIHWLNPLYRSRRDLMHFLT